MARAARNSALETRTARARLRIRRTPYFAKIAKGLRLGYYRGSVAGSWVVRCYRGGGVYATEALGIADDTLDADGVKVLDYWQAQEQARRWGQRQRLIAEGMLREGSYTVFNAVTDYLAEIQAEKSPAAVRGAKYVFDAWILPDLGAIQVEKLTTDRINRWRNKLASQPKRVRTKRTAIEPATRETPDDEDARRARKATANRILTMLKAALNRAFHAERVFSDSAWRKVKPFKKVDEAVVRYLKPAEASRLVDACAEDFRKMVQAALLTGCRYSELARLKCVNFDAANGTLAIRLSKGKLRHVVLTDEAKKSFAYWTKDKGTADHVFLRADGAVWGPSHQKRPSDEASERAGISPAVNFHILRHTHGSHLAMNGVPMGVIAAQLGHADTRMTEKHYAHLGQSYIAQTIRANFPRLDLDADSKVVRVQAKGQHREEIEVALAPKNSRRSGNTVQIYPDAEALENLKAHLPTFRPHDVTSVVRLPTSEAKQEVRRVTSSVIKQQLGELFKALGLDPSAPDAYRKGLQTLAAVHHGVGYFTSDKSIPPNRNAAKWTTQDDDLLHEFVKEDEKEGIDQALRRISKDPEKWRRLPLSSSSRSQTPANQLRYEALRKRWTRISKIAPPGSWLAAIAGDYPIYGSEKDKANWWPNHSELPPLPPLGKSNEPPEQ